MKTIYRALVWRSNQAVPQIVRLIRSYPASTTSSAIIDNAARYTQNAVAGAVEREIKGLLLKDGRYITGTKQFLSRVGPI